ncbi:MAG: YolD-like family protein [Bacilli bacterium]|nr:YolD-like family protein [Bacilli bacterium]
MQNNGRKGKWQPFDALEGYGASLRKVEHEKGKIEKPVLFPDELELLNEQLASAFENKKEVTIEYYKSGYLEVIVGYISKIDLIYKEILVKLESGSRKLKFNQIIKIEEINL